MSSSIHPIAWGQVISQWLSPPTDMYTLGYLTPRRDAEPKPLCQKSVASPCPSSMCPYPIIKAPQLKQGCCIEKYLMRN